MSTSPCCRWVRPCYTKVSTRSSKGRRWWCQRKNLLEGRSKFHNDRGCFASCPFSQNSCFATLANNGNTTSNWQQQQPQERYLSNAAVAVQLDDFSGFDEQQEGKQYHYNDSRQTNSNVHIQSNDSKHCITCTCPDDHHHHHHQYFHNEMHLHQFENPLVLYPNIPHHRQEQEQEREQSQTRQLNTQQEQQQKDEDDYPPPLPEPKVTFRRRVLPDHLVALSAPAGQAALVRAMVQQTASTYFMLTQHWDNQSDPASCGVTTLRQVLNAAGMDPTAVRWKGGWRYYGSDAMVVCRCMDPVRIQRAGITLPEFVRLAHCHGLEGRSERPDAARTLQTDVTKPRSNTVDDFRRDLLQSLRTSEPLDSQDNDDGENVVPPTFFVVSFSRAVLNQTGDGHFSTVAAYDTETDSCLVLDVARFKYPPYWVSIEELYDAMRPADPVTKESRGWSLWQRAGPWPSYLDPVDGNVQDEGSLPAAWVPAFDQTTDATCPLRPIQVQYCSTAWERRKHRRKIPRDDEKNT